ncbi:MAG TPA: hypothetical protein VF753_09860 [Terriglobales bacterium]
MPLAQGTVGQIYAQDGSVPAGGLRQGKLGSLVVHELHGRFYEQVYRGNTYSIGSNLTALSANTITLTATTTPIVGLWNPFNSPVNAVILQAAVGFVLNTLTTPVAPGPMLWTTNIVQTAITTGLAPFNRKTLQNSGSQVKGFAFTALTGMSSNLVVLEPADFPQPSGQTAGTIVASTASSTFAQGFNGVENFDGNLIVPPGGVLALINTTSTTTYSAAGRLLWEEVPL